LRPADEMLEPLAKDISAFNDRLIAEGKKQTAQLNANAASTTMTLTIVSILGIAIGIGLSMVVARKGITGPLARLQHTMATLAAGN
ncbi:methyl-accepting chemotaxis protein, partial [Pseudomonas sp. FW306-02-H06C]